MAGESKKVLKNITRVRDSKKRVNGYYVRIQWKGEKYSKLFSINEYESEAAALERAVEWRNDIETQIGKPRTERLVMGITRPTNTGEKGIRYEVLRHFKRGKRVGKEHAWYIVTTVDETGKQRRTGVSIDKHGKEKAMQLARQMYQERNYC
jgi:hypothetical protein